MEIRVGNLMFLCFLLLLLLVWSFSLIYPITMPVFGLLSLFFGGIFMQRNTKIKTLGIVTVVNGIALLALSIVIYTLLIATKVQ